MAHQYHHNQPQINANEREWISDSVFPVKRAAPDQRAAPVRKRLTLIILLWFITLTVACSSPSANVTDDATQTVIIDGRTFELELALDRQARQRGLSGRESIPDDGGMLFVFPYPQQTYFVMRECLVPIDIIFLEERGRVVAMHAMQVEPPGTPEHQLRRYPSRERILFAIELQGGMLQQLNLKLGDRIDLPYQQLKAQAQ